METILELVNTHVITVYTFSIGNGLLVILSYYQITNTKYGVWEKLYVNHML